MRANVHEKVGCRPGNRASCDAHHSWAAGASRVDQAMIAFMDADAGRLKYRNAYNVTAMNIAGPSAPVQPAGSRPFALNTGAAVGAVRNRISAWAASVWRALAPMATATFLTMDMGIPPSFSVD